MIAAAYYNEHDPKAAAWLRELIKRGLIAPGDVDERSITEVKPDEIKAYTQCHFFAGIGGWSLALRLGGWPDSRPVWTGSCPCQPFSQAGKQLGTGDERHLWPVFFRIIRERGPATVFGEQVASRLGREWLAGVRADLEGLGYEVGAADLCAAGVGAPHIRQRLYWVAHANGGRFERRGECNGHAPQSRLEASCGNNTGRCGATGGLADADGRHAGTEREQRSGEQRFVSEDGGVSGVGDANGAGFGEYGGAVAIQKEQSAAELRGNAWDRFDLLHCTDGKARRVESGTFPLANGVPARVVRLRGYGNAIVPEVAARFVQAAQEVLNS